MKLLTSGEAALILGMSVDSVRRFEREGMLRALRVGKKGDRLFKPRDVENLRTKRLTANSAANG